MTPDPEAQLIAAQLRHTIDLLRSELKHTAAQVQHYQDLANHRLAALEKSDTDHESRLRQLQESSTQFKLLASLATGGGLISLISLIRMIISP